MVTISARYPGNDEGRREVIERPTRLKIGNLWYDIEYVGHDWIVKTDRTGEISYVEQRITVADCLKPEKLADTFLHEIIHALTHHYSRISDEPIKREDVAEWVGSGLVMVWQDNPQAFEWWSSIVKSIKDGGK
jgi:hypothetical protein